MEKRLLEIQTALSGKSDERQADLKSGDIDVNERTVVFSFSSELPALRYLPDGSPYKEVLLHDEGCQKLERMKAGGPCLINHDVDKMVGVVKKIWTDPNDKRGYVQVKFSRNPKGEEAFRDVQDGILTCVSFKYIVDFEGASLYKKDAEDPNEVPELRIKSHEVLEVSLVSIPMDHTVGVARSFEEKNKDNFKNQSDLENKQKSNHSKLEVTMSKDDVLQQERARTANIMDLANFHNKRELGEEAVKTGKSLEQFQQDLLSQVRSSSNVVKKADDMGLSEKERGRFSLSKILTASVSDDFSRCGFEKEVSDQAKKFYNKEGSKGIMLPPDVLTTLARNAIMASSPNGIVTGASFIPDELQGKSFIEMLTATLCFDRLGIDVLDNLQGNILIPKGLEGTTSYWVDEMGTVPPSTIRTRQLELKPKTLAANTTLSKRLLHMSGNVGNATVDAFIMKLLFDSISQMIEKTIIYGTGNNGEPIGIRQSLYNAVKEDGTRRLEVLSPNGGGTIDYEKLVEMETRIASDNASGRGVKYLLNSKLRGYLKTTLKNPDQPGSPYIWENQMMNGDGTLNGYYACVSNLISNNRTAGDVTNATSIICGDFSQLMLASWGGLTVDSSNFVDDTGSLKVRAFSDLDICLKNVQAFQMYDDVIVDRVSSSKGRK